MNHASWLQPLFASMCLVGLGACQPKPATEPMRTIAAVPAADRSRPYLEELNGFQTTLFRRGPSPQDHEPLVAPPGVRAVTYRSDGRDLKAWIALPVGSTPNTKVPAVVYFHGGFAFGASDFEDARPFLLSGFAVMCPMLRGENGNAGDYEMLLGEVRDGKAAVEWLAAQDIIDPTRVYTFGHSAGGVVSALLALHEVGVRHGGSSGGLYDTSIFESMAQYVPFDRADPREAMLRVLVGNIRWIKRPHYAFVGSEDTAQAVEAARSEAAQAGAPLTVTVLPGDHFGSLAESVRSYAAILHSHP